MKIALQLNNLLYLYDYLSMGVELFIVGSRFSAQAVLNLDIDDLKKVKEQCHNKKVYVLVNGLYDQHEINDLENHLISLNRVVDGVLFQDFAVLQIVKENHLNLELMYSPETLNTNGLSLDILSSLGVDSAFVSRVIPIEEQLMMKQQCDIPLMIQGHGVEYIAASKRQLLSNYKDATGKEFSNDILTMKPRDSEYECFIYEDQRGTHIMSSSRLYTLDLFNTLNVFDYLYIETLMMSDYEALEVTSIYCDALQALGNGKYNKEVKEFLPLLRRISPNLSRGFLFDQTVYKLEDMRKLDNEKNQ